MENIYAIYDVKAEQFLPPFFAKTNGVAIRMFEQAANDQQHDFNKYAEDYSLFKIGTWNPEDATIENVKALEPLGNALQFQTAEPAG